MPMPRFHRPSLRQARGPAGPRLRVEPLDARDVPAAGLLLATVGDVTAAGTGGLTSWSRNDVIQLGDPNFALEPATGSGATSGTASVLLNLGRFGTRPGGIAAVHSVAGTVTVGTGVAAMTLVPGDLLLCVRNDDTFTGSDGRALPVTRDEVFLFRPDRPGDYTSGTFRMVLDDFASWSGAGETRALALVERPTRVGETVLPAGTFLFSRTGLAEQNDVRAFTPTGVGPGTTAGPAPVVLIEGDHLNFSALIEELELVEVTTTVGGRTLAGGTLLLALATDDKTVGTNQIAVTRNDIFALAVTRTSLAGGTARATASLVFQGADVGLNSGPAGIGALALPVGKGFGNRAPVATADQYTLGGLLTSLNIPAPGVLGNDVDPDGDALTAALVTGPANGTLKLNPDGSFTYTPDPLFLLGTDSFVYAADDGLGGVATATVTIVLSPLGDRPPVAADDTYTTAEDTPLTVPAPGVLANDADPDGDTLVARLMSGPVRGTLTLNPNGSFTYTPDPDYAGPDSFTYRASDGSGASNVATVAITVTPVNDAPRAADDDYLTFKNRVLVVPAPGVLANDIDPDGDPLTAALVAGPANGTVTLNADGSFVYTPRPAFRGTDSFTYRVTDPAGAADTATVTLRVIAANGKPVAADDTYTTAEDTPLTVPAPGVLANDTRPGALPLTAELVSGPTYGTLVVRPDGSFTYTPARDFYGTDSFKYRAVDVINGPSTPATVTLLVTPVNDPPVAVADRFLTLADTPLRIPAPGVLANDIDPDGDPLTAALVAGPANGTVTLNADGSFVYTPVAGFTGDDTFAYSVSDGIATSAAALVTITVRPAPPQPPSADPGPAAPGPGGPTADPGSLVPPPPVGPDPTPAPGGDEMRNSDKSGSMEPSAVPVPPVVGGPVVAFAGMSPAAYGTLNRPAVSGRIETEFAPPPAVAPPPPSVGALPPVVMPPAALPPAGPPATAVPTVPPPTPVPPVPRLRPDNPVFAGLDELTKDVGQANRVQAATGTVIATSVVASAGYVLLSPRLAFWFLSALLARRTVWKPFDPLEVVYAWDREHAGAGEDDDSLNQLVS